MLVKCINNYLIKGLQIFTQEQGTPAVSREAVLILIYAWSSCAIPLTNISRAMVVTGRKVLFLIDSSHKKAVQLTETKKRIETYAANQARLLLYVREILALTINNSISYHWKLFNVLCPDPCVYNIGDYVLVQRSVKSSKKKGIVDKA